MDIERRLDRRRPQLTPSIKSSAIGPQQVNLLSASVLSLSHSMMLNVDQTPEFPTTINALNNIEGCIIQGCNFDVSFAGLDVYQDGTRTRAARGQTTYSAMNNMKNCVISNTNFTTAGVLVSGAPPPRHARPQRTYRSPSAANTRPHMSTHGKVPHATFSRPFDVRSTCGAQRSQAREACSHQQSLWEDSPMIYRHKRTQNLNPVHVNDLSPVLDRYQSKAARVLKMAQELSELHLFDESHDSDSEGSQEASSTDCSASRFSQKTSATSGSDFSRVTYEASTSGSRTEGSRAEDVKAPPISRQPYIVDVPEGEEEVEHVLVHEWLSDQTKGKTKKVKDWDVCESDSDD